MYGALVVKRIDLEKLSAPLGVKDLHFVGTAGMHKTRAFRPPAVIKRSRRGSAGEGIWFVWAFGKDEQKVENSACSLGADGKPLAGVEFCMKKGWLPPYCSELSVVMLEDNGMRKLVEMDDDHVGWYRTLGESLAFSIDGLSGAGVGSWKATFSPQSPQQFMSVVGGNNTDKGKTGMRYVSTPVVNGVSRAGSTFDPVGYPHAEHDRFVKQSPWYGALVTRIDPWKRSAPLGVKDLHFVGTAGMRKTRAFRPPAVSKRSRGSAGEGIWFVWACDKDEQNVEKSACSLGADGKPPAGVEFCTKKGAAVFCIFFLAFCIQRRTSMLFVFLVRVRYFLYFSPWRGQD